VTKFVNVSLLVLKETILAGGTIIYIRGGKHPIIVSVLWGDTCENIFCGGAKQKYCSVSLHSSSYVVNCILLYDIINYDKHALLQS